MPEEAQVTDASAFSEGSLGLQVVLAIVTLGLYTLYWLYSTASQLDQGTSEDVSPILAIIPIVNIIGIWQISNAGEAVTDQSNLVLFIGFLILPIISWYWIQSGINGVAQSGGASTDA